LRKGKGKKGFEGPTMSFGRREHAVTKEGDEDEKKGTRM